MDKQKSWPGWETIRLIGRGSFGEVYEIQRDMFGNIEKAALKVISIPQNSGDLDELYSDGYDDESISATFQNHLKSIVAEYSMMRKLNGCANIVHCDDIRYIQHTDGIGWDIFIKMELLTPLTKALSGELDEQTVIKIGKDLCNALVLCKKHEIIHRDIKPQNIFVSDNGDYKLGDFGIAKTVEKTRGGTKIGTYKYMAPEVYNNQPYGSAADIYSLGLVLYWLLNERRLPFMPLPPARLMAGIDETARNRRFAGELIPAPAHGSDELKKIVLKACAYDPAQRFGSAAEMMAALNGLNSQCAATVLSEETCAPPVQNVLEDDSEMTVSVFHTREQEQPPVSQTEEQDEKTASVFHTREQEQPPVSQTEEQDEKTVSVFHTREQEPTPPPVQKDSESKPPVTAPEEIKEKPASKHAPVAKMPRLERAESTAVITVKFIVSLVVALVLYVAVADIFIPRIITGLMIFKSYAPGFAPIVNGICSALSFLIGAEYSCGFGGSTFTGYLVTRWNTRVDLYSYLKLDLADSLYLILPALVMLILPVLIMAKYAIKHFQGQRSGTLHSKAPSKIKKRLCIAVVVVIYALTVDAHIERLISGICFLGHVIRSMGTFRPVNEFLISLIGGYGEFNRSRFGSQLVPPYGHFNLINAIWLIVPSLIMLVAPIAAGIKKLIQVVKKNKQGNQT